MGVIGNLIPKALINQAPELDKYAIQNELRSSSSHMQRARGIFDQRQSDFNSSERIFFTRVFQEATAESAYKSLEKDLSCLRFKERAFDNANAVSTKKFINHEQTLQQNPEIKEIDTKIHDNRVLIQEKQKALATKTKSEVSYQNALKVASLLAKEISQLQNTEITIVNDIEAIKTQIQQVRSGSFSLSGLQINLTGSTSTSFIDTSKLLSTDSSSIAVLGGQQVSESKGLQDLLDSSKLNAHSSQIQEEIEAQIKKAIIGMLEDLLSQKENDLANTRGQIKQKQTQLSANQKQVESLEKDNKSAVSDRGALEDDIEQLIQLTQALIDERLEKDPELVKFSSFQNFFSKVLKGNGETGAGVASDLARTREDIEVKSDIYEQSSSKAGSAERVYEVKAFLKTTAKANLNISRAQTAEQEKLFRSIKQDNEVK